MPCRDPEKRSERGRRYRSRQRIKKYGAEGALIDQRGKHQNHARGEVHHRFRGGRFVTSHGYVAVRVPRDHPHAWGADPKCKYAYEHILVMMNRIGRALAPGELVHHRDANKQNNAEDNLELLTVSEHAAEHEPDRVRDELGRFR